MADARIIEYKISAVDNASSVFAKTADNLRRIAKTTETIGLAPLHGRTSAQLGRTADEQAARNEIARQFKEQRESVRKERVQLLVNERMFGTQLGVEVARSAQTAARGGQVFVQAIQKTGKDTRTELEKIKDAFGKSGTLGQLSKLFMGGGAIAGLAFAAHAIRDTTKAVVELADELREGKLSTGQFFEKSTQQLPILGSIREAGLGIRELATGFLNLAPHGKMLAKFFDDGTIALREANKELTNINTRLDQIEQRRERFQSFIGPIFDTAFLDRQATEGAKIRAQADIEFRDTMEQIRQQREEINKLLSGKATEDKQIPATFGSPGRTIKVPKIIEEGARKEAEAELKALDAAASIAEGRRQTANAQARESERNANQATEDRLRDHSLKMADLEGDKLRRVSQIQSEGRQEALRGQQQGLNAELEQIREATNQEIEAVGQEFKKLLQDPAFKIDKALGEQFRELGRQTQFAIAERGARQADAATREDVKRRLHEQLDAEGKLNQLHIDRLQDEAKFGSLTASLEVKKLEIAQQYADKRKDILDLLKEEALTEQQRIAALSELSSLDQREGAAMSRIGRRAEPVQKATAATGRNLVSEFLGPQRIIEQQQLKIEQDQLKVGQEANKLLTRIIEIIRANPTTLIPF